MFRSTILAVLCFWGLLCCRDGWTTRPGDPVALAEICEQLPTLGVCKIMAIDFRVTYYSGLPTVLSPLSGSIVDTAITRGCDAILLSPYEIWRNENWQTFNGDPRLIPLVANKKAQIFVFKVKP